MLPVVIMYFRSIVYFSFQFLLGCFDRTVNPPVIRVIKDFQFLLGCFYLSFLVSFLLSKTFNSFWDASNITAIMVIPHLFRLSIPSGMLRKMSAMPKAMSLPFLSIPSRMLQFN